MNDLTLKKSISAVPLNALRAFEVTARHMSMKEAAGELNVTPSAISHRLRLLEMVIGCRLFRRQGSRLRLTESGQALAPALTVGFDRIIAALDEVQSSRPERNSIERQRSLDERQRSPGERNDHVQPNHNCHGVRVAPPDCQR